MKNRRQARLLMGAAIFFTLIISMVVPIVLESARLPGELRMVAGQQYELKSILPLVARLQTQPDELMPAVQLSGQRMGDLAGYDTRGSVKVKAMDRAGEAQVSLSILGIPVKKVQVRVLPDMQLVPGGHSIGVAMYTRGALVVGSAEITDEAGEARNPAKEAGLLPGDVIERVNGVEIKDAASLSEMVGKQQGRSVELSVLRAKERLTLYIQSVKDGRDGTYRLGLWVRDSTAGVGTLTYYDPNSGRFGALGHGITDYDTGRTLNVREGQILLSHIYDVKVGQSGHPGELRGNFVQGQNIMGQIEANTDFGLFGKSTKPVSNPLFNQPLPIGTQGTAHVGPATILCTVDSEGIAQYACEIISIAAQPQPTAKGMVIRITDPKLLERTGGIVQGMSGSPILQDGNLIGAVTHVFVNDPTQGYGIFIEWMLEVPAASGE